jgi:hypothetical protein
MGGDYEPDVIEFASIVGISLEHTGTLLNKVFA